MEANPFLAYLENHREAGPDTLKELFRLLAKRTHPDLGSSDAMQFVRLQEHYHEALAHLIQRGASSASPSSTRPPREDVLGWLYRYKARLPSSELEPRELPESCRRALDAALRAAERYTARSHESLRAFSEQFHRLRRQNARYPDVRTKYAVLVRALSSFFDYQTMPNAFNRRLSRSYLSEIKPVTDLDPAASPHERHNRSAAARSALYRMRSWLESELELPPVNVF